jgi:hypothetical protein
MRVWLEYRETTGINPEALVAFAKANDWAVPAITSGPLDIVTCPSVVGREPYASGTGT